MGRTDALGACYLHLQITALDGKSGPRPATTKGSDGRVRTDARDDLPVWEESTDDDCDELETPDDSDSALFLDLHSCLRSLFNARHSVNAQGLHVRRTLYRTRAEGLCFLQTSGLCYLQTASTSSPRCAVDGKGSDTVITCSGQLMGQRCNISRPPPNQLPSSDNSSPAPPSLLYLPLRPVHPLD